MWAPTAERTAARSASPWGFEQQIWHPSIKFCTWKFNAPYLPGLPTLIVLKTDEATSTSVMQKATQQDEKWLSNQRLWLTYSRDQHWDCQLNFPDLIWKKQICQFSKVIQRERAWIEHLLVADCLTLHVKSSLTSFLQLTVISLKRACLHLSSDTPVLVTNALGHFFFFNSHVLYSSFLQNSNIEKSSWMTTTHREQ